MRKSLIALAVYVALSASSVLGQSAWTSTPKAKHHNAIVQITSQLYGGSGTVIEVTSTDLYVLGCRHVTKEGEKVTIKFPFGQRLRGTVTKDGGEERDLCLIVCPHKFGNWKQVAKIPVAKTPPKAGIMVECTGYGVDGDGGGNLRHWVAKVHGYQADTDAMLMQTSCVSGDSGGGVIFGGELVGVIYGGRHRSTFDGTLNDKGMFVHPATATNVHQVREFLRGLIPWKPANPGNGPAIPGPALPGAVNPGAIPGLFDNGTGPAKPNTPRFVTHPDLDKSLAPLRSNFIANKSLIVSLGSALAKLQALSGTTQGEIAKAIAEATAEAKAEREASEASLLSQANASASSNAQVLIAESSIRHRKERSTLLNVIMAIKDKAEGADVEGESKFGWINQPSTLISAVALLGITGLPGIGLGFTGWLAIKRLKKRLDRRGEPGGSPDVPFQPDAATDRLIENLQGRLETALAGEVSLSDELKNYHQDTQPLQAKVADLVADGLVAVKAIKDLKIQLAEAQEHTRTEYVHIPVTNLEAEAWKCAARRVAGSNPQAEPIVQLIQGVAEQIFHGSQVQARDKREPLKVDTNVC